HFKSNNPVTTTNPAQVSIKLALVGGGDPVTIPINGAHVQFTASATGLMEGQLHGSIKKDDVDKNIIPAVAMLLTDQIAKDPTSASAKMIGMLFDTGGCMDGAVAATANDGKITACEVAGNSIIQNVLASDVQIYTNGQYAPNAMNKMKDSLSLGLG